jgi:hypothetical protein
VSYGYVASWTKDHIILSRDKEVIYLYILDYVTQSPRLTIKQKVNKIKTNKYNHNNGKSKCNLELASSLFFSSEKDDEGIIREQ